VPAADRPHSRSHETRARREVAGETLSDHARARREVAGETLSDHARARREVAGDPVVALRPTEAA
jgi:hypothetical protein